MTDVAENLSILRIARDQNVLWRAATDMGQPLSDDVRLPDSTILAVPAEQVRLHEVTVTPAEAKHLAKSLPFLLEEDVAEDIDALHFAFRRLSDNRFAVAVIAHEVMSQLQNKIAAFGSLDRWLPEPLLLPWQPGECVALVERDRVVLRWGENAGTAVSVEWLALVVEAMPVASPRWVVYGENVESLVALLPEGSEVDHRTGHFGNAAMLLALDSGALNLRQGLYAPRLPLDQWWRAWRPLAIAASVAVLLQFGADLAQLQRLSAENAALREAALSSYRTANPQGNVTDVDIQLERQLDDLRGSGQTNRLFTPLLAQVVTAIAASGDIDLSTLNYSTTGDLRLTMNAPDFASVEALRGRLDSAGFIATLEGTSARGERISARLVVTSRS